jgi:transposase
VPGHLQADASSAYDPIRARGIVEVGCKAHARRTFDATKTTDPERARIAIGAEESEQLDYKPATLFVIEHVCRTYACWRCEGQVVTAAEPAQPIEKGLPGPGLLAHVITEKCADHIPLHRQERRLAREGVELTRSTLCDWMAAAAKRLQPLYDLMKTLLLLCGTIHTDDTPVKLRDAHRKIKGPVQRSSDDCP